MEAVAGASQTNPTASRRRGPSRKEFLRDALGLIATVAVSDVAPRAESAFEPAYLALHRTGELARRGERLHQLMSSCRLCPAVRHRSAERKRGSCGASAQLQVASHHPHFGEERPLVGRGGSGTIFFAHCSLRCVFCINSDISHGGHGARCSTDDFASMMLDLQDRRCHNINVVTPTHYSAHNVLALDRAAARGLRLPLV